GGASRPSVLAGGDAHPTNLWKLFNSHSLISTASCTYRKMVLSSSFRLIAESCSRVPHGTIQNPKYRFLGVLVARSFYPRKLFCAQAHNFSFQGALPSGDWVFNVVEYPSHITILS
ncbi:hypothetical protein, partial [Microcoleus sp. B4-C5]|uniref:hypothetical protein n=1 Tax=Microcoleus sp. B4-C5 TaxID=2818664 RepID=UPI002FD4CF1C